MNDQRRLWDNYSKRLNVDGHPSGPSGFALEVTALLTKRATILELGCGPGDDAVFFASAGHVVTATDLSGVAIERNRDRVANIPDVRFEVLDISESFPYNTSGFEAVYARLSLHYYSDAVTRQVFREIRRVLKPGGLLCFICKSIHAPEYGQGHEIEKDMFDLNGHIRHFFSDEYARDCLSGLFEIEMIKTVDEEVYGRLSSIVKVVASAIK